MNDLNYYKANKEQASREEMFIYIENLMIQRAYANAASAFADLKRIELNEETVLVNKINLDPKKTPVAQMKSLLRNPLAWRMIHKRGSKSAMKVPTDEAIELFRTIKVTHEELVATNENASVYQKALLATHQNWDTDWVVEHVVNYTDYRYHIENVVFEIIKSSPKMDAVLLVAEKLAKKNKTQSVNYLGNGYNLDDATLRKVISLGFASVLADPRVTSEEIIKFWDDNYSDLNKTYTNNYYDPRREFYAAIGKNPNSPTWLLDDAVNFYGGYYGYDIAVLTNPNLSAEALVTLLDKTKDKEYRLLIARHPNISMATLKKLSKSAYQPLAETALERFTQKDEERKARRRNNY